MINSIQYDANEIEFTCLVYVLYFLEQMGIIHHCYLNKDDVKHCIKHYHSVMVYVSRKEQT